MIMSSTVLANTRSIAVTRSFESYNKLSSCTADRTCHRCSCSVRISRNDVMLGVPRLFVQ
jgi:hypothetical protein